MWRRDVAAVCRGEEQEVLPRLCRGAINKSRSCNNHTIHSRCQSLSPYQRRRQSCSELPHCCAIQIICFGTEVNILFISLPRLKPTE